MTAQDNPSIAALRALEASLHLHMRAEEVRAAAVKRRWWPTIRLPTIRLPRFRRPKLRTSVRRTAYAAGMLLGVTLLAMAALWWRLSTGPIELDLATPFITAAIEENFGGGHRVAIGGTQIERDEHGKTALRIRDIVVRDGDGTIVASAPKAEVGVSGASLLVGRLRAERLSLVGATLAVRIENDGNLTIFAGADTRPIATTAAAPKAPTASIAFTPPPAPPLAPANGAAHAARGGIPDLASLLAWIDSLSASGLDGHDLSELGLKGGQLFVDDRRTGKNWTFERIDLSMMRGRDGGVGIALVSDDPVKPWRMRAEVSPAPRGHRNVLVDVERVSIKDVLLALRLGEGQYEGDIPISARLRADIGSDGTPEMVEGRILAESGTITNIGDPTSRIAIDRIEATLDWDRTRRTVVAPFQVVAGGNRMTLMTQVEPPARAGEPWSLRLSGGSVVLASSEGSKDSLILNRIQLGFRVDTEKRRVDIEQGEIGNGETGVALSGGLDYSGADPKLALGVAGNRMSFATLKKLWPIGISPGVRRWVLDRVHTGIVERVIVATNAPLSSFAVGGPPMAQDGLSIEVAATGVTFVPVDGLPPIRDADVNVRVSGTTATVSVPRGTVDTGPGRKLTLTNGVFEVPNTAAQAPPARVRFRVEGPVQAAAELLASPPLRNVAGSALDPATSRGAVAGQVALALTLDSDQAIAPATYALNLDFTNFAAERLIMNQKVEAATLRVVVNQQGYQAKGDVKIGGIPAALDYRKPHGNGDAEIKLQATLDEAARTRLGVNVGSAIAGSLPVKLNGRIPANEQDSRFTVDADLGPAKIDNLLPGWVKPAGKPARATFTLVSKPQLTRFEDITIDGAGALVRGIVELDSTGDIVSANLPVYSVSDGDKASLKADRGSDGALRVVMRGDVYDGRMLVKSLMAGAPPEKNAKPVKDLDLDIRLGTVAGFHGETLRGLELKVSRRGGTLRTFSMHAKLGRDAALSGEMRGRAGARQVVFVESADAGALFRFSDTYSRIYGGEMWVAMDPPTLDGSAQDGLLNIRDFTVRGEPTLDRVASSGMNSRSGVEFSRMRVEFTKTPGRFAVRDGVVRGPVIGATIDGLVDYGSNEVHMRGTFVPLYGLNNMFGQIPIVGLFLGGGSNEGLVGITYEVVGTPNAPVLRVNPISAVAPGLLRKFFEFPTTTAPQSYAEPSSSSR